MIFSKIERIARARFVDPTGAERVHPAQLQVRCVSRRRVSESVDGAVGIYWAERIERVQPMVLAEDAVIRSLHPVNPRGPLVPVEEIAQSLRPENRQVLVQEVHGTADGPGTSRQRCAYGGACAAAQEIIN